MDAMNVDQESSSSWRVRDAAQNLVERGMDSADTSSVLCMSSSFDVDTCLARLRRDKAAIVRGAFEAAAQTVLYAVQRSDTEEVSAETVVPDLSVAPLVEQWKQIKEKRVESMALAQSSKEKRKGRPSSETMEVVRSGVTKGSKASAESKKGRPSSQSSSKRSAPALMPTSAATSDSRLTVSKAVLCTAASVAFDQLTPPFEGHDVDVVDVPQNIPKNTSTEGKQPPTVNMGAVLLQAQTLGQRVASLVENSTRRSRQRYEYRRDNARYAKSPRSVLQLSNPFASRKSSSAADNNVVLEQAMIKHPVPPKGVGVSEHWKSVCLPRFKAVLDKGSGHAVYCDVQWPTRHARIAHLLKELADKTLGPHLIVTTVPEVDAFAQEFDNADNQMRLVPSKSSSYGLRVLTYTGSKLRRRRLREQFAFATGSSGSAFHVMVTSYRDFLNDYLHLCQLPYQMVILDDGWSWLAAAHIDGNSSIGTLWERGMFNSSDQHIGLAGTMGKEWDFGTDDLTRDQVKKACIGLTARHRIIASPSIYAGSRDSRHQGPVPGLIKFLMPNFLDNVREEWDRSRFDQDAPSMEHLRKLAARSIIVHHPLGQQHDLYQLALAGLKGNLPTADRSQVPLVPEVIPEETFIEDGKLSQSRRSALACFGPESKSWMRYELGTASLLAIEDAMVAAGATGYVCEEVVTASSLTSSGATGTVSGSMAYRLAVRCGRSFGSELGLRQHIAAMHAPPGTWLCRTCGIDCGTSPSRTAHERTCGQPPPGAPGSEPAGSNTAGSGPSTGQGKQNGPVGVVGKKTSTKKSGSTANAIGPEDKDSDGSFRVPGYRGVWVNPAGKHFVKIGGERLMSKANGDDVWFFDSIDDAAKKHDEVSLERGIDKTEGLNFKEDGSRIVYEESTAAAAAGRGVEMMGGGASSVVPALSVINIKDLPKEVTPLLRDPRQTSRTGGNSKRHVYAYRGVCRQARKGHDRWQSQISFSGTNHYLGTFDSEWDAAAIYAWAHLILYGEEATRKARLEGEEAAAAYEQEQKDIAAGKVIVPPPKPPKKKRKKSEKKTEETGEAKGEQEAETDGPPPETKKTKKRAPKESAGPDKRGRTSDTADVLAELEPLQAKGVSQVPVLEPRKAFMEKSDSELIRVAAMRLEAARNLRSEETDRTLPISANIRPCAPMASVLAKTPVGYAMLMGLSPLLFGWNIDTFVSNQYFDSSRSAEKAATALVDEYGVNRYNDSFRSVLQGTVCVIGRASIRMERAWERLGLGAIPLGGTAGELDCNIGGLVGSCSDASATIAFCPSGGSTFQFCANNDTDIVTLNGNRVLSSSGSFPLFNEDVCTVGARVFVFLLPTGT